MPDYDARSAPWYKVAMAAFRDQTLPRRRPQRRAWWRGPRCTRFFTTKAPSISAAVAARDPSGEILIVTYDLPLDEVAKFTTTVRPSPRGLMFVLTDDGRLLGRLADNRGNNKRTPTCPRCSRSPNPPLPTSSMRWRSGRPTAKAGPIAFVSRSRTKPGGPDSRPSSSARAPFLDRGAAARGRPHSAAAASTRRSSPGVGLLAPARRRLAGLGLARWFSRPLAELAAQSQRIASLDLTETAAVHSHLSELDLLSDTLGRMRDSLRKHIAEREQSRRESPSATAGAPRWPKLARPGRCATTAKDATASPIRHSPKRPGSPLRR